MSEHAFVEVDNLVKSYDNGLIPALRGVSLSMESGRIYALEGSSGCGKSTLLNLIGTLDRPDSGAIRYEGKTIHAFADAAEFRREYLGFVFQFHYLIPVLTLRENVETALLTNPAYDARSRRQKAYELLTQMDLSHKIDTRANSVSGGERQRAAIARALANDPRLILADEPTGNVDTRTSQMILQRFRKYVTRTGATLLIATHDPLVGAAADLRFGMHEGRIVSTEPPAKGSG